MSQQCALAGVTRSWVYARRHKECLDELELKLFGLIDAEYTRRPSPCVRLVVAPTF